jgi:hypothetical protein
MIGVGGRAPDRPVVLPVDRADIGDAPDRAGIDHDEAIPAAVGQIDDRALMAAGCVVDRGAGFPRSPQAARARYGQRQLAGNGVEQIIISTATDDLRPFRALVIIGLPRGRDGGEIGIERQQGQGAVGADRGAEIGGAVIVEEQGGVEGFAVELRIGPWPLDTRRAIDAGLVPHRRDRDVEQAAMMAQAGGVETLAIGVAAGEVIARIAVQPVDHMGGDAPVHQILRMEDGDAGRVGEGRGDEVEIVADADDVGIGIIGEQHRVAIGAIALVGPPHLRRQGGGKDETGGERQRGAEAEAGGHPAVPLRGPGCNDRGRPPCRRSRPLSAC